eukprot:jgi/Ulvmu1/5659/UM024_0006.1
MHEVGLRIMLPLTVDQQFSRQKGRATCGTTATTVILRDDAIHVAHCGDSRAILVSDNGVWPLTKDHKPSDPQEAERIRAKGGTIVHDDVDRVCGVLAVTRAFGNNAMKATVSAEPEVLRHVLQPLDRHVAIASDGVWDVLSNEDVAVIVRGAGSCRAAAEDITLEAYRLGSSDNISAVVFEVNAAGPWSRSVRMGAAVRSFSNRGVKPRAGAGAGAGPPAAAQGPLTAGGLPHGITTTVGAAGARKATKVPPLSSHTEHPMNVEPSSQDGLGAEDGYFLGPPPLPAQPQPCGHIQSYPAVPDTEPQYADGRAGPSPAEPAPAVAVAVVTPTDAAAGAAAAADAAAAAAAAMHAPGAVAVAMASPADAAGPGEAAAAAVQPHAVAALAPSSSDDEDDGSAAARVCQSAPIVQGRSAAIAREYAKDRAVYVHRPAHDPSFNVIHEDGEAPPAGGSLPVSEPRGRGHVYAPPRRPSRDGVAAVLRGGELNGEIDVGAQQRAAVLAAEEDARVRAQQEHDAFGYPS